MNVSTEEVLAMIQTRFPHEFEICVLAVQNQKLQQQLALHEEEQEEKTAWKVDKVNLWADGQEISKEEMEEDLPF